MKKRMLDIAADGRIEEDEQEKFSEIMGNLDSLAKAISELRMLAEKYRKRE